MDCQLWKLQLAYASTQKYAATARLRKGASHSAAEPVTVFTVTCSDMSIALQTDCKNSKSTLIVVAFGLVTYSTVTFGFEKR